MSNSPNDFANTKSGDHAALEANAHRDNRLAKEQSPYLRQHQHNPVPWFAWGADAIQEARRRDVPLFVSSGYSTCYWCHVMERENFENAPTGELMGNYFVCVKVDREQRPDLDAVWMSACQVFTAITEGRPSGGWPLHVFLEPHSLRPFFAGTYFPPTPAYGRISFPQLLERIANLWKHKRADVLAQSEQLARLVEREMQLAPERKPLDESLERNAAAQLLASYDHVNGGFGSAPKFPQPSLVLFLQAIADARCTEVVGKTLNAMARGGIRDQLDGGFHRYAVDATWTVPHFEKMLYDQGQLLLLYATEAHSRNDAFLRRVALELGEFLIGVMQLPTGAFAAAIDAEVAGHEGQNYVWLANEVEQVLAAAQLNALAPLACQAFALDGAANFRDPHHQHDEPRFVLTLSEPPEVLAKRAGVTLEVWWQKFDQVRGALLSARKLRCAPSMDRTCIASWNALAIEGLARAGRVLGHNQFIIAAVKAADDVFARLVDDGGEVFRSGAGEIRSGPGFLEDYACLCAACLELFHATKEPRWLQRAQLLAHKARQMFWTLEHGWVEAPADTLGRIAPIAGVEDGAVPSGAGVMVNCLVSLAQCTEELAWLEQAYESLDRASGAIAERPLSATRSVIAAMTLRTMYPERVAGGAQKSPVHIQLVPVGNTFEFFHLVLDIALGFHISAMHNDPAGLIANAVQTQAGVLAPLSINALDTGVKIHCDFPVVNTLDDGSPVYSGRVTIVVTVRAPRPSPRPLRLQVRLQVCSAQECLAPEARLVEG